MDKKMEIATALNVRTQESYVSQILNKKNPLTATLMKVLHQKLGIPAEISPAA
jgi:antitoxin component HigA of HigAB toxin-antitoxin module